ncbi:MAG: DEAD/DEAH box helicase [Planctomycetes bacterium]|nr:DEAD/DEAH box helicase [Planctomycetota bacterium]
MEQGALFQFPRPERRQPQTAGIPDALPAQFREAARLLQRGRPEAAWPYVRRAMELDPRSPDATLLAAQIALENGDLELAQELSDQAQALARVRVPASSPEAYREIPQAIWRARAAQRRARQRPHPKTRMQGPAATVVPQRSREAAAAAAIEVRPPSAALTLAPCLADALAPAEPAVALTDILLRLDAGRIAQLSSFDHLLSLGAVRNVDHYEYQLRTVRRALRDFRGRVLLADEVGLGKTIEAGLCLKEYLLRGLVRRALVLAPASLCAQWRDELGDKFLIDAWIADGEALRRDPEALAREGVTILSLGLARMPAGADALARARFDLAIVDEAHRLKNRRTRSWQVVDALKSRFLLLLSATPIENDLIEIYNVLTLLKPGLFSTEAEFKRTFVARSGRGPRDPERLRGLLREVMIRNTRALADVKLPPRFATTLRATPAARERELYQRVERALRAGMAEGRIAKAAAGELLHALGSTPHAATGLLARLLGPELAAEAEALAAGAAPLAKDETLLELLGRQKDDKVLLFAGHRRSLDHAFALARQAGRRPVLFHGSLGFADKQAAIGAFAGDADVLVTSESGGEGFNLHFARTVVNYDLPWNPMRIEQRIGRVHRIGQTREVFVFNLATVGTIEDEVLRVLDEKINLFELVVGEVEMILGRLGDGEQEFQDLVLEIYARAGDAAALRAGFDELAERLLAARDEHARAKRLQDAVLGTELGA